MEVAHNPYLNRTHTAPLSSRMHTFNPSQTPIGMPSQGHQSQNSSSHYSTFSGSSFASNSRSSNATPLTPSSTLGPTSHSTPPLPTGSGPIQATDSVLNTRAGQESSLFQICLNLRQRLGNVPGLEETLQELEEDADEDTDPVTLLWRTFRRGYPLMTIYNALNPAEYLEVDPSTVKEEKRPQAATMKFLSACLKHLKFPSQECFIISDLYGDDTTGFVKVAKVVNRVLDILVQQGFISAGQEDAAQSSEVTANAKRSQREHIIDELVRTERTYVQHLELLQSFKKLVEERGIITSDAVHNIFLNLNALLDFQRRFLIRIEQTNAQPESEQNWGKLFVLYKDAFKVYEPFIANQKRCEDVAMQNFDKLKETGGTQELRQMVESPTVLSSFLLKPFQRLAKYPLLLKELKDKGDLDEGRRADIAVGIEAASSVLQRTNAAVDREERNEAVEELKGRVEDWKGHKIEAFGDLLLHGTFTVLKGEMVAAKNSEREYKIYLFEMILLCCKEIDISKTKNKTRKNDASGKPKLQLKGRIFMQNVTDTLIMQKPGSYTCQIFWKGDPGIENFIIRFPTEEKMKKWAAQVDQQRRVWKDPSHNRGSGRQTSTSATEFTYMKDQGTALVNPYAQEYENEEEDSDETSATPGPYGYRSGANGSSHSLRSRAGTGDSIFPPNASRMPPSRFPLLEAPTTQLRQIHTSGGAMSPQERDIDSYFSPTADSPISTRTSSSSNGLYQFNRQPGLANGWHPSEEHLRYTAPAMGRSTPQARGPQRPSLPPNPQSTQALISQSRLRSASSPDIQPPMQRAQVPDVPVPPFPAHYAYAPGAQNRSQPNLAPNQMLLPTRSATQSPSLQRDRLVHAHSIPAEQPAYYDPRYGAVPRGPVPYGYPPQADLRTNSPPTGPGTPGVSEMATPTQLKVKVHCPAAGSSMTLVVGTNISYQSLKDRIDAKLQRSTNMSLTSGQVKLKYLDEGDYISIQSDEDVQTAFESWKEQQRDFVIAGQLGEIELYCQ